MIRIPLTRFVYLFVYFFNMENWKKEDVHKQTTGKRKPTFSSMLFQKVHQLPITKFQESKWIAAEGRISEIY